MDHWELGPHELWGVETDAVEPNTDQQAFAAYEDAWSERDRTGYTSVDLLVSALRARRLPASEYAEGTRLWSALSTSWHKGRRPRRMHGVILRYRMARTADTLRGLRELFGDGTPAHMRLPENLVPATTWRPADDTTPLPFTPAATFTARVGAWYDAVDDDRERAIPVWLDTTARPERTPVMVGSDLAGYTDLPLWAHELLTGATRTGRRVVATGDLWVKRRKDGTWRTKGMSIELPERGDRRHRGPSV